MIYLLVPHAARSEIDFRFFLTFSAAEQAVLVAAQWYETRGEDPHWCTLIAYDGIDELRPVFLYSLVGSDHLQRDPYPSPSP
jgi:hypothetical protein